LQSSSPSTARPTGFIVVSIVVMKVSP